MPAERAGIRTAIVEDEAVARRTLRRLLEQDPDIELVGEAAGSAAPGLILETRPDLVFLDVQMPGMTGLDVIAAVRTGSAPVVFVTAHDELRGAGVRAEGARLPAEAVHRCALSRGAHLRQALHSAGGDAPRGRPDPRSGGWSDAVGWRGQPTRARRGWHRIPDPARRKGGRPNQAA